MSSAHGHGDRRTSRGSVAGTVDVVVIGAGHAGLAMSACLDERGIDHVILEKGSVANAWRTQRWDSLRLLTPNWLTRLPGHAYTGPDPDGFMGASEVAHHIANYARRIAAPVHDRTTVASVQQCADGYRVETDRGIWRCRAVVLASGAFARPSLPACHEAVPSAVRTITPCEYRNPGDLGDGGVLVVGASATGLQIAEEIQRSGRRVTLAVGEHVRMPRLYRGQDIQWWMHAAGILDQRIEETDDSNRARRVPSPQLIGTPERRSLDLNGLRAEGVEMVGRLAGIRDTVVQFSGSLANHCTMADLKMQRLLNSFDDWARETGVMSEGSREQRFEPTQVDHSPRLALDLARGEVGTILWATGMRPDYSYVDVPMAFDRKGRIRHDGGVVATPGMYTMGLTFMRRRKSSFIHGAEDDARELVADIANHLDLQCRVQRTTIVVSGAATEAALDGFHPETPCMAFLDTPREECHFPLASFIDDLRQR